MAAAALPANLAGASPATTCGGTATYGGGAGGNLSLSGASLAASATCTVTLTVSSTVASSYSYTTGVVSSTTPATTGTAATTPTALTVTAPLTATQVIASRMLTANQAATPFTPVTGSGGTPPLSYSVAPALPAGLTLAAATGQITGTPTVASAATTYTVTVTDANTTTDSATFSLTVNGAVVATQAVPSTMLTANQAATPFTPVTGSGGTSPLSYSVAPALPAGLTLAAAATGTQITVYGDGDGRQHQHRQRHVQPDGERRGGGDAGDRLADVDDQHRRGSVHAGHRQWRHADVAPALAGLSGGDWRRRRRRPIR